MSTDPVQGSAPDIKQLMQQYADIQTAAYTSQSAKKADIDQLKTQFASYFEANDSSKKTTILGDLDKMSKMAAAHEADSTHTDNEQWDSVRSELDTMIKELAPSGTATSVIDQIPHGGGSGGGSTGSSGSTGGGGTNYAVTGAGQGNGSGFSNLDNPSSSKNYTGKTLDELLQSQSAIGSAMRQNPGLVAAIRKASESTGVPGGLLAATAYAESSFGLNAKTTYNVDHQATGGVFQMTTDWMKKYNPGGNVSNVEDNTLAFAKAMADQYSRLGDSWGSALRAWTSSGYDTDLPNAHNLRATNGAGDPDYVVNVLGKNAMGNPSS